MAYVIHGRGSGFSYGKFLFYRTASVILAGIEKAKLHKRLRATDKALRALDDDQLKDIGLDRSDVLSMANFGPEQTIWCLNAARNRASRKAK